MFISLSEGYTHYRIFKKWLQENHITEQNILYAKEIQTIYSMARSTSTIAFMSDITVGDNSGLVKVSLPSVPKFYIRLITNGEAEMSLNLQEFNEIVVEAVKDKFDC